MSTYTKLRNHRQLWQAIAKIRLLPGFYWLWKLWFHTSKFHWQRHYERGGDSGPGSYGQSATYKADLVNRIISERQIRSLIELGCGDGNQLASLEVERYIGLDISKIAIQRCFARHGHDATRSFIWYDPDNFHDPLHIVSADCAMSLDVIFHLVEDDIFSRYVECLFNCGRRYVIIYALDQEETRPFHVSVKLRKYSDFIAKHFNNFRVVLHIPAKEEFGDLFLYERISDVERKIVSPGTPESRQFTQLNRSS